MESISKNYRFVTQNQYKWIIFQNQCFQSILIPIQIKKQLSLNPKTEITILFPIFLLFSLISKLDQHPKGIQIVNLNSLQMLTIPQMHKHLQQLSNFYTTRTTTFVNLINSHPGRFTSKDSQQFSILIEEIKNEALTRINTFFNDRLSTKCELYDSQITDYSESSNNVQEKLVSFRDDLEDATIELKKEQNRRENLLESFSKKYSQHLVMKRTWKVFIENRDERKKAKELDRKMDRVYRNNLLKKAFFPWRTLTYKDGYENTVRRETEKDIQNIHEQYQSIIDILKAKIGETDDLTKVKRAAKGEFAFALSKNLLKTISNLSLEVMSLNQMSLRDGESDESETRKFMKSVQNVIGDKLAKVKQYKTALLGEAQEEGQERKKKKKITFV